MIGLSSTSPGKTSLLWRRVRHFCADKCRDKKLAELNTTLTEIKTCCCDVAPIKDDIVPWVCPPCSYKNDGDDKLHDWFQEGCVHKASGGRRRVKRKARCWEDRVNDEHEKMKTRGYCGCGEWAKDAAGQGFMVCSWCQGEVKLEWS